VAAIKKTERLSRRNCSDQVNAEDSAEVSASLAVRRAGGRHARAGALRATNRRSPLQEPDLRKGKFEQHIERHLDKLLAEARPAKTVAGTIAKAGRKKKA